MTYKDHFVVEVKCKGKILRVQDDIVRLPFGSEYSIYLKNLNSRRASVDISIDGEDVLDGKSLVLDGNESTELEGFLKGNVAKNRFKFINKTKEIQEHRGDKADDGILRVEFAFEKKRKPIIIMDHKHHHHHHHHHDHKHWNYNDWFTGDSNDRYTSGDAPRGMAPQSATYSCSDMPVGAAAPSSVVSDSLEDIAAPLADEGITVKGSECNQQFHSVTMGELEQAEVIIIRLKGATETTGKFVSKPVTVKTKLTCSTCGLVSKSSAKFCSRCGTFLE
jgi:hypothetical protein